MGETGEAKKGGDSLDKIDGRPFRHCFGKY